jgi:PleD family two-component response regulator
MARSNDDRRSNVVLHVGEDPRDLMLLRSLLTTRPDQRLVVARDAWAALPMAQLAAPALVVLGSRANDFSDEEVLNLLRCLPGCARVPVIATSSAHAACGSEHAFAAIWSRPLQAKQLQHDLDRLLPTPAWDRATAALPPDSEFAPLRLYPAPAAWHGHRLGAAA